MARKDKASSKDKDTGRIPENQEDKVTSEETAEEPSVNTEETAQEADTSVPEGEQADGKPEDEPKAKTNEDSEKVRLEKELKAERERYVRMAAEYDNYRKRSQKEREALYSDVKIETVKKFLPVYDNLSRALQHECADEAYKKGVEMTMNQLNSILANLGVTEISALGETFDPTVHNAVLHIEDEAYGESEIVEEFEKGFKLGDKVIRFSLVKVAN